MKKHKPEPITKVVNYQSDDNSVELYSGTRAGITETYLRRGNSIELVEGEVSLKWKPEEPEHVLNFRTLRYGEISQHNGLKTQTLPKLKKIMLKLRKAERKKAKIKLGLSAVSGGGKTTSALLIAYGICGDWSKIAIIDTENNSADLYSHLGDFNVYELSAPYTPERYIEAIRECEEAGMSVIIVDSITHEWDGKGGILDISNLMAGNSYTNWAKITPRHQAFINAILQSKCHVITTVRRKQDYELIDKDGKKVPQKVGLKEVTRDGFEYELTVNLELDTRHYATASKDRTGLFMDKPEFIPTIETGKLIAEWCERGVDVEQLEKERQERLLQAIQKGLEVLAECKSQQEVIALKDILSEEVTTSPQFKAAANAKYKELTPIAQ